ncbi:MAG: type-F conjugative transfer system secretin TraK [Usitatibacteraceae bacterium]
MIRISLFSLVALALVASGHVMAAQYVDAVDGKAVPVNLSQREMTLIKVDGGRINKLRHNPTELFVEADQDKGEVFVKPLGAGSKPINFFVVTENASFPMLAVPVDTPSDSIIIREKAIARAVTTRAVKSGTYVRSIKNLLLAATLDTPPPEVEVRVVTRNVPLWAETRFTLQRQLLAGGLLADHYLITNLTSRQLVLEEQEFYKEGVVAAAVEQLTLASGEVTNVFILRERGRE